MQDYDPDQTPDPAQWQALGEGSRMMMVKLYHDSARIRLPKPNLHYAVHVVVENQVAEGMPAVLRAMQRLQGEGLSRHDALHAIASVAARRVAELLQSGDPQQAQAFEARYAEELDKLTAQEWRKLADAS
jgi:hypothetical protein